MSIIRSSPDRFAARVIRHPASTKAIIELDRFAVTITFKPAATPVTLKDFDFELHC
jgi:hypothetical protein